MLNSSDKSIFEARRTSVCVVEDDADLRIEIMAGLEHAGLAVRGFPASRELYLGLLREPCEVVVLDVGLPGEDGFTVLSHLRATLPVGIILLTARGAVADRIRGLREGADAYLVKPVDLDELAATVSSVARRVRPDPQILIGAEWRLSPDGWFLQTPKGARVSLSASERVLLERLLGASGRVVSREVLVEALGYHPDEVLSNRLDMSVSRLRRKVQTNCGESLPLRAVRGVGFSLVDEGRHS
ncbi:MAG: response regulator transcription factor [Pseudomonadota bacterium]